MVSVRYFMDLRKEESMNRGSEKLTYILETNDYLRG